MTATPAPRPSDTAVARSTAAMTVLTAVSRATGLVRLLVMAAVLGTTYLGNTYESANTVPNVLFEFFAAGMLQAVVVPGLVELLDRGDQGEAEHVAGSVLGLGCLALGAVAAVGILFAESVMGVLVSGVADEGIRAAQIELGAVFLRFFLPQVVLYVVGLVATGVLNAHGRFALPVVAPVANNVVVTAAYVWFWQLRDGSAPGLRLSGVEQAVLAGGTTLGVVAFCAVPLIGALRLHFSLRPRFDHRHPRVRELARRGMWAALYLAMTQLLLLTLLVLANGVEGGVVAYRVAFNYFLVPHALFAIPVFTALYPRLAREAIAHDWSSYARSIRQGLRAITMFVLPASAVFIALDHDIARVTLFGASAGVGVAHVADALLGLAPGLAGYGAYLFLTRAFYAAGDTRTPALVTCGLSVVGSVAMVTVAWITPDRSTLLAITLAHSTVYLVGSVVLLRLLRRRLVLRALSGVPRLVAVSAVAAAGAGAAMWTLDSVLAPGGRADALAVLAGAAMVGAVVFVGIQRVAGGVRPAAVLALLRHRSEA